MAQHFLLSSAAKSLTLGQVARMSDEEAERVFIRLRWADNHGKPYCGKCGCVTVYASRRKGCLRYQWDGCVVGVVGEGDRRQGSDAGIACFLHALLQ